jgi:hypothetical protein
MKKCPQCNGEKPFDAFAVDSSKKDGRKSRCKECDAAKKKKAYYAASPKARSNRVTQQRYRRWKDIAQTHGERWLIEQVQALKETGRLPGDESHKAEQDDRLAAFFREAHNTSSEVLRTHLGSRLWDRVAHPFTPKKERDAATKDRREELQARLFGSEIAGLQWNDDDERYEGVYDEPDDSSGFARFLEREASNRILREGRFAPKRPEKD